MTEIHSQSDDDMVSKIYLHFVGYCFIKMAVLFALQKLFRTISSYLLVLDLTAYSICVLFRKLAPLTMSSSLFLTFSAMRLFIPDFILRFLIHLDLIFVQGERCGSTCILYLYAAIQKIGTEFASNLWINYLIHEHDRSFHHLKQSICSKT